MRAPGQRERTVDIRRAAQDHQPTANLPRTDARVDARTVHERDSAQVEHDEARFHLSLAQRPVQLGCRRDVQLAGDAHPAAPTPTFRGRADERSQRNNRRGDDRTRVGHEPPGLLLEPSEVSSCCRRRSSRPHIDALQHPRDSWSETNASPSVSAPPRTRAQQVGSGDGRGLGGPRPSRLGGSVSRRAGARQRCRRW